jgi:hypothetical protein
MKRNARIIPWIVALLILPTSTLALGKKKAPEITQTHFSAEDNSVQRPVAMPVDIVNALKSDHVVQNVLKNSDPRFGSKEAPASWFSASIVHLSDEGLADFVVVAEGPLAGVNMTTFWVFAATPNGHKLVLNAPAHDLEVTLKYWEGYREIELSGETAVEFKRIRYRWDGNTYNKVKSESHEIR